MVNLKPYIGPVSLVALVGVAIFVYINKQSQSKASDVSGAIATVITQGGGGSSPLYSQDNSVPTLSTAFVDPVHIDATSPPTQTVPAVDTGNTSTPQINDYVPPPSVSYSNEAYYRQASSCPHGMCAGAALPESYR